MRILVVEDHEDIREMLAEMLRLEGYEVLEAENGQVALSLIDGETEPLGLVLLDLMMPVMNGVQVLERLSAQGRLDALPVVVLTASGRPELAVGAREVLRKPPDHDHLLQLVRRYCGEPALPAGG